MNWDKIKDILTICLIPAVGWALITSRDVGQIETRLEQQAGELMEAQAEIKALGPNAQSRLASIRDWGKANLDDAQFQAMRVLASTAEGVGVLEAIISKTREAKIPTGNEVVKTGPSEQELQEMVADPRYASSAAYRKEVERKFEEFYGKQPYQNVVQ